MVKVKYGIVVIDVIYGEGFVWVVYLVVVIIYLWEVGFLSFFVFLCVWFLELIYIYICKFFNCWIINIFRIKYLWVFVIEVILCEDMIKWKENNLGVGVKDNGWWLVMIDYNSSSLLCVYNYL